MKSVADGKSVIGKPVAIQLSEFQRELLLQAGFTNLSESTTVVSYSQLYVRDHNRVVETTRKQKRRNNSCISYFDRSGADRYGLLQRILLVQDNPVALVVLLSSTAVKLSTDVITHADIDSHIIACSLPR